MKTLLIIICSIVVLIPITVLLLVTYEEAKATQELEAACIHKHIQLGIERRDIHIVNGTCFIRTN
jgi:hypothetical protein